MRTIALALLLCTTTAYAQARPADAPLTVEVSGGRLLTTDARVLEVDGGVYLNDTSARNVAGRLVELERANAEAQGRVSPQQVALVVGGALVLGFLGGVAVAHLLPAK